MNERRLAKTAAKWWADTFREPVVDDVGDLGVSLQRTSERWKENDRRLDPEMVDRFEDALEANLLGRFSLDNDLYRFGVGIGVNYHPDEIIRRAAVEAGFDYYTQQWGFPAKTRMLIKDTGIEVSAGYAAGYEEVPLVD